MDSFFISKGFTTLLEILWSGGQIAEPVSLRKYERTYDPLEKKTKNLKLIGNIKREPAWLPL
jgi:hypothetical protein